MATRKKKPPAHFPVVGIGASAGGLAAFEAFFAGLPTDAEPGMAFVLVQHLDPDHKSLLTDLIRRYTRMQVFEVEDGMMVQPNCTYIIPPNRDMSLSHGRLQLFEPSLPRGFRLPIDFFFRSLAQDQHERAIGVVLSGTGSDGALGVRAIKGEGGMVMVQSPDSTEFDGMPNSALATGLVDYTLEPAQMAPQILAYARRACAPPALAPRFPTDENAFRKIFVVLRDRLGHDFSQYKPGGVERRVQRRMAVHQVGTLTDYLKYLQRTPAEVDALFGDLLIGVTHFFRDSEDFQVLDTTVIPQLLNSKPAGATVRAWSVGCSTGEEAYSIAILFQEHLDALQQHCQVQVFATDIDSRAIAAARSGLYPVSIAADVSAERLERFFTLEPDGRFYRVARRIRDLLVFSEQDVIRDPPFSRLDLIVCRNLLIYMGAELQKKLMPIFHYALNPGAVLFLGNSESIGEFEDLFAPLDRKAKLYQRKDDFHGVPRTALHRFRNPPAPALAQLRASRPEVGYLSLRQLTEQALLQRVVPAAALVNSQGDILYLHGRTGLYLELAPGEAGINNVLKMAREGLRYDLSAALHKASASLQVVHCPGLRVQSLGQTIPVQLTVHPLQIKRSPELPMFLVLFEECPAVPAPTVQVSVGAEVECDARVVGLKQELQAKEEFLQSTIEELESSNEELKSSNEEMQSVNEELQSTNEELETSKEELQSVNEELSTVNNELQSKLADFTRLNNDMNNLLAGTGIATVFLDLQLRVLRFTPASTRIVNLIVSDLGRPMAHIVPNLVHYDRLTADAQAVLDTLVPQEIEVNSREGRSYKLRIQPYRTLDNVIEGVVISFVDITEMVRLREGLRQANDLLRLAVVVRDAHDAMTVQDLNGSTLAWNPAATRMYGWTEAEALLLQVQQRIPQALRGTESDRMGQLVQGQVLPAYASQRLDKDGNLLEVLVTATALIDPAGHVYAVATTERPVNSAPELDGSHH